jgi:gamma-glutamyltranspeptidase/glutathione hydrolase
MRRTILALTLALVAVSAVPSRASQGSHFRPGVSGALGVVATESPAAARVGRGVLESGGDAIDAAVATVFALNVARPQSCGIGGGGFMVYRSRTGKVRTLDFRETAPAAIRPDQFQGNGIYRQFTGHTTVGVPGVVAGMDAALARYGTLSLRQAIAPAEQLARDGVRVTQTLATGAKDNQQRFGRYPESAKLFLPNGQPLQAGSTFRQPALAADFRRIMKNGPAAFYTGTIARRIVTEMQGFQHPDIGDQGLLTMDDFARYRPRWRTPLAGTYKGAQIFTMGPPTSGGVALLEMLNLLEPLGLRAYGQSSANAIQLIGEAQRLAWADRNQYLADPDQVPQPTDTLISKAYADRRRGELSLTRTHSYAPGDVGTAQPGSTTHLAVIDARGNAVSLTCTIEQEYGSAVIAPGTGFLLNNELTDFGTPGTANAIAPFKRPRSSMTPVIVARKGRPVLVTGGAGGSLIIMGVAETVLDRLEFGLDVAHAVDAERVDDQGSSQLRVEDARMDPGVLADLQSRGWTLVRQGEYGPRPRVNAAGVEAGGRMIAVADPRADDGAVSVRKLPNRPPVVCATKTPPKVTCPNPSVNARRASRGARR